MVNVFPEPVTPSSTWCLTLDAKLSVNALMALGWSPVGWYFEISSNLLIKVSLPVKPDRRRASVRSNVCQI